MKTINMEKGGGDDKVTMKKNDLIQQATTRLRRRQLEEQLSDMMNSLTEMQSQAKFLSAQISAAMDTTRQLTGYDIRQQHQQMDLLEDQVKLHQAMLNQWFPSACSPSPIKYDKNVNNNNINNHTSSSSSSPQYQNPHPHQLQHHANDINKHLQTQLADHLDLVNNGENDDLEEDIKTVNMSRLSSLSMISSLFSRPVSSATSVSDFTEDSSHMEEDDTNNFFMDERNGPHYRYMSSTTMDQQKHHHEQQQQQQEQWNQIRRYQRRIRVKHHRQRHQHCQRMNHEDDQDNVLADLAIASSSPTVATLTLQPSSSTATTLSCSSTSPCTSLWQPSSDQRHHHWKNQEDRHDYHPGKTDTSLDLTLSRCQQDATLHYDSCYKPGYHYRDDEAIDNTVSDFSTTSFCSGMDYSQHPRLQQGVTHEDDKLNNALLSQRTVLDDAMDFLEQFDDVHGKDDGRDDMYDEQFLQDMAFLLDHPELCHQPLAELAPLLEQHHLSLSQTNGNNVPLSSPPTSKAAHGSHILTSSSSLPSPYINSLCNSGWQWCRFLSVLSASYMVSLLKGPDDLLID